MTTRDSAFVDAATLIEDALTALVGCDSADWDTGFFDLGADSLAIVGMVEMLRLHGAAVRPVDLFSYPTVRQLASHLVETGSLR